MAASKITKKYHKLSILFGILSFLVLAFPLVYYVISGFINGEVHEKTTLGITVVVAVLMFALNVVFKFHIRSTIWILVLGIYYCIDNIMPLLLMVAIGTILDEFLLSPLHKSYKNKCTINKEIDKRVP